MDDFATKGTVNVGDAVAALAIVRALLKNLQKKGAIDGKDVNSIVADALAQLGSLSNNIPGRMEAKRLIQKLNQL